MAVIIGSTIGAGTRTQEHVHAYMQSIRKYLLAVGMQEVELDNTYDASESGGLEQIPIGTIGSTSNRRYSNWMHFQFTDNKQAEYPIVVSFRTGSGGFFSSSSSSSTTINFIIAYRVSQGVDSQGLPIGANYTYGVSTTTSASSSSELTHIPNNHGDFASYSGESLTLFLGMDSISSSRGLSSMVSLHVERTHGSGFASIGNHIGSNSGTQIIHCAVGSNLIGSTDLQARAGGISGYFDSGSAVVSPIFAETSLGRIMPLKRVFTVASSIASSGSIIELDFIGEPKNYLLNSGGAINPYHAGGSWIYEWS